MSVNRYTPFWAVLCMACSPARPDKTGNSADDTSAAQTSRSQVNKGEPDNPTPQVSIISPVEGAQIKGPAIPVHIETKDFKFAYDRATKPGTMTTLPDRYAKVPQEANSGHVHVYLARYPAGGKPELARFFMVQKFLMPNTAEFTLDSVAPGRYRLLVELVADDHSPRIKHHPTDWPSLDLKTISVR
jgi:hypothetical protein